MALESSVVNSTGFFVFVGGIVRTELFLDGVEPGRRRE